MRSWNGECCARCFERRKSGLDVENKGICRSIRASSKKIKDICIIYLVTFIRIKLESRTIFINNDRYAVKHFEDKRNEFGTNRILDTSHIDNPAPPGEGGG